MTNGEYGKRPVPRVLTWWPESGDAPNKVTLRLHSLRMTVVVRSHVRKVQQRRPV